MTYEKNVAARLARLSCLCSACLQLELAEEQALRDSEARALRDILDTPRDQREVASRLNIQTRKYGYAHLLQVKKRKE